MHNKTTTNGSQLRTHYRQLKTNLNEISSVKYTNLNTKFKHNHKHHFQESQKLHL